MVVLGWVGVFYGGPTQNHIWPQREILLVQSDLVHTEQQPPVNNGSLQTTKSKMSLECGKPFNHESTLGVR